MNILEIKNLSKYYEKVKGVEKINFSIEKGEIFGFIGPNGAGKSTTIRVIMQMIFATEGKIFFEGTLNEKENIFIKNKIGYLPAEINLYDDLTVKEMINYSDSFYEMSCKKRANYLVKKLKLDTSRKIDELSLGNLKKLGIVLAMMHKPEFLIFDEATSGLDPLMQQAFYELLKEEKESGTTIFFSSHNLTEVKQICDKVGVIKEGKLVKIDSVKNLIEKNFYTVTIVSKKISKIKNEIIGKIISEKENEIKMIYSEDINEFINSISQYKIDKMLIEEPSLEEIFMHYYV